MSAFGGVAVRDERPLWRQLPGCDHVCNLCMNEPALSHLRKWAGRPHDLQCPLLASAAIAAQHVRAPMGQGATRSIGSAKELARVAQPSPTPPLPAESFAFSGTQHRTSRPNHNGFGARSCFPGRQLLGIISHLEHMMTGPKAKTLKRQLQ
jgi:hypothetical protein